MATKRSTKKPTGLGITRSGNYITITWTRGETYNSQQVTVQWYKGGTKTTYKPGATAKKKTLAIPTAASLVTVTVKGHTAARGWSDTATKTYQIHRPPKVTVSTEWDENYENRCLFKWAVEPSESNSYVWRSIVWQTALVKNFNGKPSSYVKNGKLSGINNASYAKQGTSLSKSGSVPIAYTTEPTPVIADGSYTRIVRVRSDGPYYHSSDGKKGADSVGNGWVYSTHTYATPNMPIIGDGTGIAGNAVTVVWTVARSSAVPSDRQEVQYTIAEPDENMQCPDSASWTTAQSLTGLSSGKAIIQVPDISPDNACWVRVVSFHDSHEVPSSPYFIKAGTLSRPSDFTIIMPSSLEEGDPYTARFTATNNCGIDGSFMVVVKQTEKLEYPVAVIPAGETTATAQLEYDNDRFAIYAVVGSYTEDLAIDALAKSAYVWYTAPVAPVINVSPTDTIGTALVTWTWQTGVDAVELSWVDFEGAWTGTSEPSRIEIDTIEAPQWYIQGLETGTIWYIRARFKIGGSYGVYSAPVTINLTSAPAIPVLALTPEVITQNGQTLATWGYVSTDGTPQAKAQIIDDTDTVIAEVIGDAQSVTLNASIFTSGVASLRVIVTSASGHESEPSDSVVLTIADPLECTISNASFVTQTEVSPYISESGSLVTAEVTDATAFVEWLSDHDFTDNLSVYVRAHSASEATVYQIEHEDVIISIADLANIGFSMTIIGEWDEAAFEDDYYTVTIDFENLTSHTLTRLPLTLDVNTSATVTIQRAESFYQIRPDETEEDGYEGEVVYTGYLAEGGTLAVAVDDLTGYLDDTATYKLIALAQDDLGQTAQAEIEFTVAWEIQAVMPEAVIQYVDGLGQVKITSDGTDATYEIYRLSQDRPQLVYQNAEPGTVYVDPFPASGGGYRIVYYTATHDYITAGNIPAFLDETPVPDFMSAMIDFDSWRVELPYDVSFDNSWKKDFEATEYLGGSVQGDWNPAVGRSGSVSARLVTANAETINGLRRLAAWAGICHLRTPDGSSYACDIEVSESRSTDGKICSYSLDVTRVDPEGFEMMTLEDYNAEG